MRTLGVLGNGKTIDLAYDMYETTHSIEIFDDAIDEFRNTKECDTQDIYVAVGNGKARERLFYEHKYKNILTTVHNKAYVSKHAHVSVGSIIAPNATVLAYTHLGIGSFVYASTTIDVKSIIGDFTRISANCYIGDKSVIGKNCIIGASVTILPGVVIGDNCYVTAGSVVTRSFGCGETISGVPARSVNGNNELHRG